MLKNRVLKTIKENNLIKKGDKIVLGISGGPDSICLFNALHSLKSELNLKLVLVHVNYGFRGADSDLDEKLVKKLANKYKIALFIKKIEPKNYAKNRNLEEYFREIRYKFFQKILKHEKANKIAVAHNKDDQIETILMFFLRGSGISGLSGMKIKNNKIIRPLFNIEKKEILNHLKKNKIKYRKDKSNENIKFIRNKIRQQLIPYLENNYNPNLKNVLFENSKIIRDDYDLLLNLTKETIDKVVQKYKSEYKIDLKKFNNLHLALKRRLLIYLVSKKFKEEISLAMIKEILKIIKYSRNGSKKCLKAVEIIKNYDKIVIRKRKKQAGFKKLNLKITGETEISELNIKLKTRKVDRCGQISKNECYIDLNKVGNKLFIRTREKGDKFYPKGIAGSQKLKDFFINNKVEKSKRNQIVLVVTDRDEIVWIVGYRADRRFEASAKSQNVLKIKVL
jgi:tRNA(Ile)-lysidine synthase